MRLVPTMKLAGYFLKQEKNMVKKIINNYSKNLHQK